jgi:predicted DNA-binding antitoxin AbrB/MazE fold protein
LFREKLKGVTTMSYPITATYANGVLHPLTPLDLPEHIKVQIIVQPLSKMLSVKEAQKPTMAELLAQLHEINKLEPVEIEIPARKDRPNPLLEMPDEFFV